MTDANRSDDARPANDESRPRLPPNQQLVKHDHWPYVGEREPAPRSTEWTVEISGLVNSPRSYSLDQLARLPQTARRLDIHCVTRWSKYDMLFSGVLLSDLLTNVGIGRDAEFVSFAAHSARHHSTSLILNQALALETLIATEVDGMPLPVDHGGPVRSIVPNRYFYKSVKWLRRIELLSENRLGYWESTAGYHDHADPWLEQRYMAPDIDRRLARRLIESRDFSEQHLRSIDCHGRMLDGLRAPRAILRDADFTGCSLRDADFSQANLSNARFGSAILTNAKFCHADLEGADFSNADLSGADLRGSSLFGCSFSSSASPASQTKFTSATKFDAAALQQLTSQQRAFVEQFWPIPRSDRK